MFKRNKKTFDDSPLPREPKFYVKPSRKTSVNYISRFKDPKSKAVTKLSLGDVYMTRTPKNAASKAVTTLKGTYGVGNRVAKNIKREELHLTHNDTYVPKNGVSKETHINFDSAKKAPSKLNVGLPAINFGGSYKPRKSKGNNLPSIDFDKTAAKSSVKAHEDIHINFDRNKRKMSAPKVPLPSIHFAANKTYTANKKHESDHHINFAANNTLVPKAAKSSAATKITASSYNQHKWHIKKEQSNAATKTSIRSYNNLKWQTKKAPDRATTKIALPNLTATYKKQTKAKDKAKYHSNFSNMSKEAHMTLYAHPTKKPVAETLRSIKQRETRGANPIIKGANALNDHLPFEYDKSRTQKRIQREHTWYVIVLVIGLIGFTISAIYGAMQPLVLFSLLSAFAIYGYWTSR